MAPAKTDTDKNKTAAAAAADDEAQFVDYCNLSIDTVRKMSKGTDEDRMEPCIPTSKISSKEVLKIQPMSLWEETACVLFLAFVVPLGVFTAPPIVFLVGKFILGDVLLAFTVFGLLLLPLAILPQAFVPSTLQSWIAYQVCRYFSFRFICEERPPVPEPNNPNYHPRIYVAPPHGMVSSRSVLF
jgi:hypothetical protein